MCRLNWFPRRLAGRLVLRLGFLAAVGGHAPAQALPLQVDGETGYEAINEDSGGAPGLRGEQWNLGFVRGLIRAQEQLSAYRVGLTLSGEGGGSLDEGQSYGAATLKPEVTAEFKRQTHHAFASATLSDDETGFVRSPLSEQWDNVILTPDQRKHLRYLGFGADHYFELAARFSLSLYEYASYLDRGIVSRAYGGGGYLEYEATSRLRLRLGGTDQLFYYGTAEIRSSGPEATVLYQLTANRDVELKGGVTTVTDATGEHQGMTGKATFSQEEDAFGARLSWERGVTSRLYASELTTSDTLAINLRSQLSRAYALELQADDRQEEAVRGYVAATPAETLRAELRLVYQAPVGASLWLLGRSGWNALASVSSEQLTLKTGPVAMRQVFRLSCERVL